MRSLVFIAGGWTVPVVVLFAGDPSPPLHHIDSTAAVVAGWIVLALCDMWVVGSWLVLLPWVAPSLLLPLRWAITLVFVGVATYCGTGSRVPRNAGPLVAPSARCSAGRWSLTGAARQWMEAESGSLPIRAEAFAPKPRQGGI